MRIDIYPHYITWETELSGAYSFQKHISKKKFERIQRSLRIIAASDYSFQVDSVDQLYLEKFFPIYKQQIEHKPHATIFDVAGVLAKKQSQGRKYEAISLSKNGDLQGGMIYSLRPNSLNVAFRIFPHLLTARLPIAPSYIAEHYLFNRALALGKEKIIHGRDRNPYGENSGLGVAEFKLSLGLIPYVSKSPRNQFRADTKPDPKNDTLVLLGEKSGERIEKAILLSHSPATTTEKYSGLFHQKTIAMTLQPLIHSAHRAESRLPNVARL